MFYIQGPNSVELQIFILGVLDPWHHNDGKWLPEKPKKVFYRQPPMLERTKSDFEI